MRARVRQKFVKPLFWNVCIAATEFDTVKTDLLFPEQPQ